MIRSHSLFPEGTSIGVLFVGFLALAVVIMSSSSGVYTGDLNRFLSGPSPGSMQGTCVARHLRRLSRWAG